MTMPEMRMGSASFTVAFWPSRNLTEIVLPSTLAISPRTRTGGACCAHTTEAVTTRLKAAMTSVRRVIFCIFCICPSLQLVPADFDVEMRLATLPVKSP